MRKPRRHEGPWNNIMTEASNVVSLREASCFFPLGDDPLSRCGCITNTFSAVLWRLPHVAQTGHRFIQGPSLSFLLVLYVSTIQRSLVRSYGDTIIPLLYILVVAQIVLGLSDMVLLDG